MMALVEHVRTMDLTGVRTPTLVLYNPDDRVVDAKETLRVVAGMSGTEPELRVVSATSDPSKHVLAGDILSPQSNEEVLATVLAFLQARDLAPDTAVEPGGER